MRAARHCTLPPSPRAEPPPGSPAGTPNSTTLLALSATVPPRMVRPHWCLSDYVIGDKLYTGGWVGDGSRGRTRKWFCCRLECLFWCNVLLGCVCAVSTPAPLLITLPLPAGYASTVYKSMCKRSGETVVLKIYTLAAVSSLVGVVGVLLQRPLFVNQASASCLSPGTVVCCGLPTAGIPLNRLGCAARLSWLAQVCDLYKYQIYREVRVHASLDHEHVIKLFAAFQEGDRIIMVQVRA
jgi:hypothetical protein